MGMEIWKMEVCDAGLRRCPAIRVPVEHNDAFEGDKDRVM
jgi:hypothetical protein